MARVKRMGELYSAGDVTVDVGRMHDVNPSAVEYGSKYAHTYRRGIRREPQGWSMGAKEMEFKLTLPLDVSAAFEKIAPGGELAKIRPFPCTVVTTNAENEIIVDEIIAKFTGNKRSVQGDEDLEDEYEMFPLDIKFNVGI